MKDLPLDNPDVICEHVRLVVSYDPENGISIEFFWREDEPPGEITLGDMKKPVAFGCELKGEIKPVLTKCIIGVNSRQEAIDHLNQGYKTDGVFVARSIKTTSCSL